MATNEKQNPKPQKKKLTQLPAVRNLAGLWFLFLLLAALPLWLGITGIGEWKTETHEETIVYPDYREGTPRETDVKFNAVSAVLLGYTCEITEETQTIGNVRQTVDTTDHYAYLFLTDAEGNQGVFYRRTTSVYNETLKTSGGSYITADEIEALIAEINENGKTVYGTTVENKVDEQVPDATPLMKSRGSTDYLKLKAEASANLDQTDYYRTLVCLYDDDEVPFTRTVTDSREYVIHPIGVVETVIGGIMVLLALLLLFLNPRCQAEENAEILEKVRAEQDARAAAAKKAAAEKAAAKKAAEKAAAEKAAAEKAAAERQATEQRLAEEKQAAQKHSAQERAEVNAQLIPAWKDGSRLIDALLQSDPAAIQQRLRTADAYDLRTFIWELDDELAVASPDEREILEAVSSFAEKEL